ncbi:lysylphosphatidylglycerol synthase domain-containing protein [Rosistilla oblonga]|uniref:Inner membrane protein YbhN n=1 Tax=Rosistilla oblonga TaxID=2527990 RepID=A0A518IYG9_9BACT|nr:lysylphosphatidylglycerol synthase domain-containing protein [Rosistilla oblonga]QDV58132.1 Inner membrane protein YbhN [Rosistilla oblonga]
MNNNEPSLVGRLKKIAGPVFGLILFSVAASFLYKKTQEITWDEFAAGVANIPLAYHLLACLLVALNYFVLTGNDVLAVQFVGAGSSGAEEGRPRLSYRKVGLVSFLAYAFSNNIGAVAAGIPIRVRFYSGWGLGTAQIVALLAFTSLSFWVGVCMVGGVVLSIAEIPMPPKIDLPVSSRILGFTLLAAIALYAALCTWWRRPLPLAGLKLLPPGPALMRKQIVVASMDLILVATTLYVLLPSGISASYLQVVGVYLLALAAAMLTQVPGGLGVLEAILLTLLASSDEAVILGALLIFRIYYYVVPLLVASVVLATVEVRSTRAARKLLSG